MESFMDINSIIHNSYKKLNNDLEIMKPGLSYFVNVNEITSLIVP